MFNAALTMLGRSVAKECNTQQLCYFLIYCRKSIFNEGDFDLLEIGRIGIAPEFSWRFAEDACAILDTTMEIA